MYRRLRAGRFLALRRPKGAFAPAASSRFGDPRAPSRRPLPRASATQGRLRAGRFLALRRPKGAFAPAASSRFGDPRAPSRRPPPRASATQGRLRAGRLLALRRPKGAFAPAASSRFGDPRAPRAGRFPALRRPKAPSRRLLPRASATQGRLRAGRFPALRRPKGASRRPLPALRRPRRLRAAPWADTQVRPYRRQPTRGQLGPIICPMSNEAPDPTPTEPRIGHSPDLLGDMTANEFREAGHRLVDWIADYLEHGEHYPVLSRVRPGQVASTFASEPPASGAPFDEIWQRVRAETGPWPDPLEPADVLCLLRDLLERPGNPGRFSVISTKSTGDVVADIARRRPSWKRSVSVGCAS